MTEENGGRPVLESELSEWRSRVGVQKVQEAVADAEVLRRFALAAGINPEVERHVPQLGHWALFVDAVDDDRIGADGHPKRGDFLPAVHLPRRMFASAEITFQNPLVLGQKVRCISTITSVAHKKGRAGDLVFVKVLREVSQAGLLCTREEQTLVYRPDGGPTPLPIIKAETVAGGEIWHPGPVQLFRFSAVTYNSHRIHYDLTYARQEEGYPDLVVHGPFTAVKLLDLACRKTAKERVENFSFRGVAPMFVSQPIQLAATDEPGLFIAIRCDGVTGMTAKVDQL